MKIYVARHGDSLTNDMDHKRQLSEKGRKDIKRIANFLSHQHIQVSYLFHSGILRAEQTAELLALGISSKTPNQARAGLEPLDSVLPLENTIATLDGDAVFVGHLPFVERLVGRLVTGDEHNLVTDFQAGTIVCLELAGKKRWIIRWMLCPDLLPAEIYSK